MTPRCPPPVGALLAALLVGVCATPPAARAGEPATNAVAPAPATNAPGPAPLWSPTPEQQQLEREGRFVTIADPANRVVHHRVLNATPPGLKETSACTFTRSVRPDGGSIYSLEIVVVRPLAQPAVFFDSIRPVVVVVDGVSFPCPTDRSRVQSEKVESRGTVSWQASYVTQVSEKLVRALAQATAASVKVSAKNGGPWERQFGPDELARFATFARVYLPKP